MTTPTTPADILAKLLGMGIEYHGDIANQPGRGAVTATADGTCPTVTVTLEDGRRIADYPLRRVTTPDTRTPGDRITVTGPMHGAPYLAQIEAAHQLRQINTRAAQHVADQAHQRQLSELIAAHPTLTRGTDGNTAAANIRRQLRAAFPGVRFSVTQSRGSMCSAINIRWTDGPTDDQVSAIADAYRLGKFDGMDDSYTYTRSAWCEAFGGVRYVHTHRSHSDELVSRAIETAAAQYGRKDLPTVTDYRQGLSYNCSPMLNEGHGHWSWSSIIHRTLADIAA